MTERSFFFLCEGLDQAYPFSDSRDKNLGSCVRKLADTREKNSAIFQLEANHQTPWMLTGQKSRGQS